MSNTLPSPFGVVARHTTLAVRDGLVPDQIMAALDGDERDAVAMVAYSEGGPYHAHLLTLLTAEEVADALTVFPGVTRVGEPGLDPASALVEAEGLGTLCVTLPPANEARNLPLRWAIDTSNEGVSTPVYRDEQRGPLTNLDEFSTMIRAALQWLGMV